MQMRSAAAVVACALTVGVICGVVYAAAPTNGRPVTGTAARPQRATSALAKHHLTAQYSKADCAYDNAYTYHFCFTMKYNSRESHGRFYVQLVEFQLRASGARTPNASITDTTINTGAEGDYQSGGGCLNCTKYYHPSHFSPNRTYDFRPFWTGRWINVAPDDTPGQAGTYVCGNAEVTLKHGATSWKWDSSGICEGNLLDFRPPG